VVIEICVNTPGVQLESKGLNIAVPVCIMMYMLYCNIYCINKYMRLHGYGYGWVAHK
jgi:hypothetical protein